MCVQVWWGKGVKFEDEGIEDIVEVSTQALDTNPAPSNNRVENGDLNQNLLFVKGNCSIYKIT